METQLQKDSEERTIKEKNGDSCKVISGKTKIKVYRVGIRPVATYGTETMKLTKKRRKRIYEYLKGK